MKSVYSLSDLPRERIREIAVAGKSNVGKSTLLNKLVGQRGLAKTSRTPGKTQCLNFFRVQPEKSDAFHFVDLPGYGHAQVSKKMRDDWGKLIDGYLALADRPAGVIALFDARREPTEIDKDWLAWLVDWGRPYLVVLTKSDKLTNNEKAASRRRWTLDARSPLLASSLDGAGMAKIWHWVDQVRTGAL